MAPLPGSTLQRQVGVQVAQVQVERLVAEASLKGDVQAAPVVYPREWYMTRAEIFELSRGGISVDNEIKVVDEPDEVRAARAKAEKERLAQVATSYATAGGPPVKESHDTIVPKIAGLSLKWASVVRDVVQDLVKHPGPGTLYGGYGDKTTSSATELLGWINDYIAKLGAAPDADPPRP